ncbi:MAG: methyltransferase domain-containing protein [Actinomycetota bacterium]
MSTDQETFQLDLATAERYEADFVPALFASCAQVTLDAVEPADGDRLVDVACGSGIVARTAANRWGDRLTITGIDLNPSMLTVARRLAPSIDWRQGDAAALPLDDDAADVATCQMAAMFFPDRVAAFAELARVVKPGGRVAVVVPATLDAQAAYGPFMAAADAHVGPEARSLLDAYWSCGDPLALGDEVAEAGLEVTDRRTQLSTARFASPAGFVDVELGSTPLADRVTGEVRDRLVADLAARLERYLPADGGPIELPFANAVVTAVVPG